MPGEIDMPGAWAWAAGYPCMAGSDTRRAAGRLQGRAAAEGLITWDVSVDSTVARAHQHGAGARRRGDRQAEPPGGTQAEPGDHAFGVPAAG
jgi:hypothetical protein